MKVLMACLSLLLAQNVFAEALTIQSCKEAYVRPDTITEMRQFSNGQIKLFAHDREEPAAAPVGVQISYHRGNPTENYETFCVYVSGLSDISLKKATAQYSEASNTLYVYAPGRRYDGDTSEFIPTTVTLTIRKEGRGAADIFSASAR